VQPGTATFIPDAGGDRQTLPRHDRDAIWSRAGFEHGPRLQAACINPSQARCSTVGYKDDSIVRNNARGLREPSQCGDVSARVVVDHLDTVAVGMGHENPPGLWIEGAMIERTGGWYLNRAEGLQWHDDLERCFRAIRALMFFMQCGRPQ
jgi:hypothetical protein